MLLTKLCTVKGRVLQGASISTDVANLVFRETDYRLNSFAQKYEMTNTRYIDDMSFSGQTIHDSFKKVVKSIIVDSGFNLNDEKEEFRGQYERQLVTGPITKYKKPRVPRNKKREWRKEKYIFNKFESKDSPEKLKEMAIQRINGRAIYLKSIANTNP